MKQLYAFHSDCSRLMAKNWIMILLTATSLLSSISGFSETCNNVTWGGTIGSNQSGNVGYNPSTFLNVNSPSGGSGTLEYMWLYKNSTTDWVYQTVSGATAATYDAPSLSETTIYRRCSRRALCPTYDGESNEITVTINCSNCNNLSNGGTIGSNQTGCVGFDAAPLTNVATPTGGSGSIQTMWLYKSASTGWNLTTIPGATSLVYDPGVINEDTYFRRCSRRQGCTDYVGESNDVFIDVSTCCNAEITALSFHNLGNNTNSAITNGATYAVGALPANWNIEASVTGTTIGSVKFTMTGAVNNSNTENSFPYRYTGDDTAINLGAGTYTLKAEVFTASDCSGQECDELIVTFTITTCDNITNGGQIGSNQSGCAGFNPEAFTSTTPASGGTGVLEYKWMFKSAITSNVYTVIPGATAATFDAPAIFETTTFRRYARRTGCGTWVGESNEVVVTVNGNCTPEEICTITGYENLTGRIFWIPNYGTDFAASTANGGMKLEKFSNGTAHLYGVVEQISNTSHRFAVSIWLVNKSTYSQWIAAGKEPKSPNLGDETTWIYYDFATTTLNTLVGQGALAGVTLYLTNQNPLYGFQLGNGANALTTGNNGISAWFSYTGTMSGNGDINGSYNCQPACAINVDAGPDKLICGPTNVTLTSTVTGAASCTVTGTTDCNHVINSSGGWLLDLATAGVCGDNAGAKLWTQGGSGTSYIVLDLGTTVPAGTAICVNMKLEHCNNSSTSNSSAKIQASTAAASGYVNLTSAVTFSQTAFQEFCYTLAAPARYIKVLDNGFCAFRVDYVEYTTPNTTGNAITYLWTGPGIVGANNNATVTVSAAGTYTITVTDCNGCVDTDTAVVTQDATPPVFTEGPHNYNLNCNENVPLIQPVATDNNGAVTYTYTDSNTCSAPNAYCNCTRTRVWTATDPCGNTATFTQVFHVTDTIDPILIGVPSNTSVLCSAIPTPPIVVATDICDSNVPVTYNQVIGAGCPYTITRTWTAADDCGNDVSATQVITVTDNVNPVLHGIPANITLECGQVMPTYEVWATDNCDNSLVVALNAVTTNLPCGYIFTRTWSVSDDCGNSASASQVITVVDTTAPVLNNVPAASSVACGSLPTSFNVTATDVCDTNVPVMESHIDTGTGCNMTRTFTWTATDDCNNTVSVSRIFTVYDNTDPILSGVPANATVQCNQIPGAAAVTATDNCDTNVPVTYNQVIGAGCPYIITRTWTATDDCGNDVSAQQILTVIDTEYPVLHGVPANTSLECNTPAPAVTVWATDNCSTDLVVSLDAHTDTYTCGSSFIRTWSVTDACGNTTTASQVITYIDTTNPVLVGVPANATVECNAVPAPPVVTATDNCSVPTVVYSFTQTEGCPYTITRTWVATDACGNHSTSYQVITVVDTHAPTVVSSPEVHITIECGDLIPLIAPVFADNCDTDIHVDYQALEVSGGCVNGWIRKWTAIDNCGNTTVVEQIVSIIDTTLPTFDNAPANVTVECDAVPVAPMVTASDNCDDNVAVTFTEIQTEGCPYTITRTWVATDNCYNSATYTQIITVVDTTYPVLHGVPANVTLECDVEVPAVNVWASDNCTEDLEVSLDAHTNEFACGSEFVRTWSVTDACGNTTTLTQTITFVDTTDPYVTAGVPAELTIECDEEVPSYTPQFADNCDTELEYTAISGIANVSACGHDIEIAWTATDDCGNATTVYQVIHIVDTTNPVLVGVPANTTVECDAVPAAAIVTATDNCSNPSVEYYYSQTEGCPYTITRTWTATDSCGNQSSQSQIILVVDTMYPVLIGVPADATVECSNIPAHAIVTATDNCSDNEVGYYEQFVPGDSCTYQLVRVWSVTDNCGNTTTDSQTLTVIDTIDPTLIGVPANITVECDAIPAPAEVTGDDNCDPNVEVTYNEYISEGCPYIITRTWVATDNCGNNVSATQTINVIDTTYPVLHGVPANITLECDQPVPAVNVWATDNCSVEMDISIDAHTNEFACGSEFVRTWSVTDACGNTTTLTQTITFVDTTDPYVTAGVPAELTIECDEEVPSYTPQFADNCDTELEYTAISGIANVSDCGHDIEIAWTATDDCGNATTVYQVIHIVDTTNPVLVGVPANTTVECDAVPAAAIVTATDNCSNPSVEYYYSQTEGCPYTITRTWTATDSCGNQSSQSQIILVVDTTYPVLIGVPADATVECSNIPAPVIVTATDNCSDNEVGYYEQFVPGDSCTYQLVRVWSVTDNCGNTTTDSQTLTVIDTIDPTLIGVPANITVECDAIPAPAEVTGDDNCDDHVVVTYSEYTSEGCPYIITRTWVGTDNCGNDVSAMQTITVIDTTYPVLHGVPANVTLECDQPVPGAEVWATDNCTQELVVDLDESVNTFECGSEYIRTWSVTDACGNVTTLSQTITFEDTTVPYVVAGVPAELIIECDQPEPFYLPSFGDNCDDSLSVTAISGINNVNDCGWDVERAWTATDNCGNATTVYQVIHVVDTTNPVLVGVPANTTVECDAVPAAAIVTATDNCSEATVEYYHSQTEGCPYTITRTWTATDVCGNQYSETQTILVIDTTVPSLIGVPANATVECSDIPAAAVVTATDNCDTELEVVYEATILPGNSCTYTIVRTWSTVDNCGNDVAASQILTVTDTTDPTLVGVPANITVECDAIPAPAEVTGADNCDENVLVSYSYTATEGCPYTITRTWVGVDNCGNDVSASQVITVIDTTYPVLHGVPANITLECDQPVPGAEVWATDNCTEELVVELDATTNTFDCGSEFIRTWSVADACGNVTTLSQTVTFIDTTVPYVTEGVPSELTIECDETAPFYMPSFDDNCDADLEVTLISGIANVNACGHDIQRAWTATDNCGNATTVYQVIHVVDTTNPVLVGVPTDVTVECSEIPAPANVTATDNCTVPVVTYSDSYTEGCPYTITRTWVATDVCGNYSTASQVLTVIDTTDPIISNNPPIQFSIECGEEMPVFDPIFTDNCDENLEVEFTEESVSGSCPGGVIRTWVATDDCDNSVSFQQIIFIHDTTAPALVEGVPSELTLECDDARPFQNPTFADICDLEFTVSLDSTTTNITACSYDVVRTWVAIDYCENSTIVQQVLHIVDTTAPWLIGVPENITIACSETPEVPVVTALDNCDTEVSVSYDQVITPLGCGFIITRTWTASDDCGNTISATQIISAIDEIAPTIEFSPADATYECSEVIPVINPIFADNCDNDLTIVPASSNSELACGYIIHKSWTATDDCGNSVTAYQDITVVDTTAPVLVGTPASVTVECDAVPAPAFVSATDNCDINLEVSFSQDISAGCPYTITRTWSVADDCFNAASYTQIITVIDTVDPIISAPANVTVECNNIPAAAVLTATDNCDNDVDVDFTESISGIVPCEYTITRTWTATDNCDNQTVVSQVITVLDTTYPVLIGVPADVTVECDAVPAPSVVGAADNCATDLFVSSSDEEVAQDCGYIIYRTYSVADYCGHVTTQTQVITVVDTTDPIITFYPGDLTIECGDEIPTAGGVEANDNCDNELEVSYDSNEIIAECGYIIVRTWTVTDNCGNQASASQYIYVVDETSPVISGVPADITIECDQDVPAPVVVTATDNCDTDVAISSEDMVIPGECGYQIKRYYYATDDCGNMTSVPQIITVVDTTDPIIVAPADVTVPCSEIPAVPELSADDNCDDDVAVTYSEVIESGCPYSIIRTWVATDDCGNSTTVSQIVSVYDEVNPVFDPFEPFVDVECDQISDFVLTATDNCDAEVTVTVVEEFAVSGECYGSLLRTYLATDNCGNTASAFQVVNIVDSTPPVLHNIPAEATIACGEALPAVAADVFATDNCTAEMTIGFTQTQTNDFCPYDVIRTWTVLDLCGNVTTGVQVIHVTLELNQIAQLSAYPNPAREHFTVKFSVPTATEVYGGVYDITGRMIMPIYNGKADGGRMYNWDIDASQFQAGSYTIKMKMGDEVLNQRLMITGK